MKVELLQPHGFCAGVRAAIAKALTLKNVHCLHALVHNEIVTDELKALGYVFVDSIEDVPEGGTVVFSAHGVSPQVRARAAERHLTVVDTTCPFVAKAHDAARGFAARGMPVVVLGDPQHVEVKGLLGELPANRPPRAGERIGVIAQTTMDSDEVARRVAELRQSHTVETVADVCTATKARQDAVRNFTGDALLVLGSATSANTRRLAEVATCRVFMAATMDDVRRVKKEMAGYGRVGVTAGASTPERLVESAVAYLRNVPEHVAIIMDGNGRWAAQRGKRRGEGHIAGAKTLTRVVEWCGARGIRYLSVYAFSTENWKRPREEVAGLLRLLAAMIRSQARHLVENRVRLRLVGRRGDLPPAIAKAVDELERKTAGFERQLIVCFSYGGRAEIVDAVNQAIARGEKVTEETFRRFLYAPDVPDPDLVIRTSGEIRTSNFLLWESAYSEYFFTDTLWPDFSEADLDAALASYAARHRRRGGVE